MNDEPQDLRRLLSRLPDTPVPSNFTVRVMQAVEREEMQTGRAFGWRWRWHSLLPRAAAVAAVVLAAGLAVQQHETRARREQIARSVAFVAAAEPLPSLEALKNFDAIRRMGQPARADQELLDLAPNLQ